MFLWRNKKNINTFGLKKKASYEELCIDKVILMSAIHSSWHPTCRHLRVTVLYDLRGLDTLGRFSVIFYKDTTFFDFLFVFLGTKPFMKICLKQFFPRRAKSFLSDKIPFRLEALTILTVLSPLKVYPFPLTKTHSYTLWRHFTIH